MKIAKIINTKSFTSVRQKMIEIFSFNDFFFTFSYLLLRIVLKKNSMQNSLRSLFNEYSLGSPYCLFFNFPLQATRVNTG